MCERTTQPGSESPEHISRANDSAASSLGDYEAVCNALPATGIYSCYPRQRASLLFDAVYHLTIQNNYDTLRTIRRSDKTMPGKDITLIRRLEKTNPICRTRYGMALR